LINIDGDEVVAEIDEVGIIGLTVGIT